MKYKIINERTKGQIRRAVGMVHISKSDETVRRSIRARMGLYNKYDELDSELIKEALEFAVEVHHKNQDKYNKIMG